MMNSGPGRFRQEVSRDTPQISPSFGPYTGFLTPPSPYSGIDERRGSIVSLSASEYSVPTPTSERSPFSEASWQHVTPFGGFQTQSMPELRHAVPLGAVGLPMKSSNSAPFCNDWAMSTSNVDMPLPLQDAMPTGTGYLSSQMSSYAGSDHVSPSSQGSNWSFSTAPEHPDLGHGISGQQPFWPPQMPSTHPLSGQTIAPSDALVGGEDYGFAQDDSNSFAMETEAFDNAPMSFAASPNDNVPMDLPPSPQEVQVKREIEGSEPEERFTRSIRVSPRGGKTVRKERQRTHNVSKRKSSKSKFNNLVVRRSHDGTFDVEGYQLNPLTGKREPIGGPTVNLKYCDFPSCNSRFKRPEHLKRHQRIHFANKDQKCRVDGCPKIFDRRDNYWQHGTTHIHVPGKKDGRNPRLPFKKMLKYADDEKHVEFLEKFYRKQFPEGYPSDSEDESVDFGQRERRIRCNL